MGPMSRHQLQGKIQQLKQEQQLQLANSHHHLHGHSHSHSHSHSHGHYPQTLSRDGDSSRDISRLRRRQMMQRHINSRRGLDRVRRSSELQVNLYRFLNQQRPRQNPASAHVPSPSPSPLPTPPPLTPPPPPPRDRDAIRCLPGELLNIRRRQRETEHRRRLLHAIGLLNKLPMRCRRGDAADGVESKGEAKADTECRSGAANIVSVTNANAAAHQSLSSSSDMVEELQQLGDSLRYLSLACRLRPALRGSAAGIELARELEGTRRIVAGMLKRSGCGGGDGGDGGDGGVGGGGSGSCGEDRQQQQQQKKSKNKPRVCEPVFWRCPVHTELMQRRSRQKQQQPSPRRGDERSKRCPPARSSSHRHGGSGCGDSVGEVVSRAKSALLGDAAFHVSSLGKEFCWGKMTVPVSQRGVTNAADRLGREHLHRCRMRQRREAAAAEIEEFADRVVDKWEAIEATRVDRSIDAACRRLRRAIRSTRRGRRRHSSVTGGCSEGRGEFEPSVGWKPVAGQPAATAAAPAAAAAAAAAPAAAAAAAAAPKGVSGECTAGFQVHLPRNVCAYI